jgi:hypothetical protein
LLVVEYNEVIQLKECQLKRGQYMEQTFAYSDNVWPNLCRYDTSNDKNISTVDDDSAINNFL